jgi:hypothetical protein
MKKLLQYGITSTFVLVIALIYSISMGAFSGTAQEAMKYLSNAFFIPGVVVAGVGALIWIGSLGTFDGISYSIQNMARRFSTTKRNFGERQQDFYAYKQEKEAKGRTWYPFIVIVGCASIGVSVLFQVLFSIL